MQWIHREVGASRSTAHLQGRFNQSFIRHGDTPCTASQRYTFDLADYVVGDVGLRAVQGDGDDVEKDAQDDGGGFDHVAVCGIHEEYQVGCHLMRSNRASC